MLTTAVLALLFAAEPGREIIHLADWHWISEAAFVADGGATDDYPALLDKVDAIQREQMEALRELKAKTVWIEGESDDTIDGFFRHIETLKAVKVPKGDSLSDQVVRDLYRENMLQIGAAGRLLLAGEIDDVLPLEDHAAWRRANPIKSGKIEIDQAANDERERAMVRRLLKSERAVIVLGADHDLRKHVPETVKYRVVRVKGLP